MTDLGLKSLLQLLLASDEANLSTYKSEIKKREMDMKKVRVLSSKLGVVITMVTAGGSVASACPNLAGIWNCSGISKKNQVILTIEQQGNSYNISDEAQPYGEYIADGKEHTSLVDPNEVAIASCIKNDQGQEGLLLDVTVKDTEDDTELEGTYIFTLSEAGAMTMQSPTRLTPKGGTRVSEVLVLSCSKAK